MLTVLSIIEQLSFMEISPLPLPIIFNKQQPLLSLQNQVAGKIGTGKMHRWVKTKWTPEEDKQLTEAIGELGTNNWTLIATRVVGRTGKQCRERWYGQICPTISKLSWTQSEDLILFQCQKIYGNKWAKISQFLPNRSPISVKNRWNWYARHQNTIDIQKTLTTSSDTSMQESDSPELPLKPINHRIFEPIELKNEPELFGAGFEEFRLRMFGSN